MEELLREFDRGPKGGGDDPKLVRDLEIARRNVSSNVLVDLPRRGGDLWRGEELAREVTEEVVERADRSGSLRGIIDAIRSNRVQDDFSPRWSRAREDFERKLHRKRSRIPVTFVELRDQVAVQGPASEVEADLVFGSFLAMLNAREGRVVILLRSGETKVGEIASLLGYRNHSPVSKALARIRQQAADFFELNRR